MTVMIRLDVIDRRPSGRWRPSESEGRHVLFPEGPHRCQGHTSPHDARPGHSGATRSETASFVGIDVSKAELEIALRPAEQGWTVSNDERGIASLVARLCAVDPALIVIKATGGLELPVTVALATAGLPVAVVNPRQARDFAKATGRLAKTDALDALALAHLAEAVRPTPRMLPEPQAEEWSPLLTRRCQLIEMLTAEKNRLSAALYLYIGDGRESPLPVTRT